MQRKVSGCIDERLFLYGKVGMVGVCVGKESKNVECTEDERENDVIAFSGTYKESGCGIEELGERVLVVEECQENFHAALGTEKCRWIS